MRTLNGDWKVAAHNLNPFVRSLFSQGASPTLEQSRAILGNKDDEPVSLDEWRNEL
ncbi:hypothetical protein BDV19DRAFT_356279 [Aspergillus venezuelensis]